MAPLLAKGNSCGHDFDFHLVSWFDALNAWRHGILYPHWTASANYGAGEPRFVFYSPLTWMMGAALASVLPWTLVPVVLTFLLLAGTGLASRALALEALEDGAATLAGCVALFSGYALFTAYERSAFAELAGGIWIPLVLLYALRNRNGAHDEPGDLWRRAFDGSTALLAVAIAGAWLSNPTVGVMACYLLAAVTLVRVMLERSLTAVLRASAGAALGMGLTAIYLVPAAWEQRWVDIHQVTEDPQQTLENNWLFAVNSDPSMALHDRVLHTASVIVVIMIATALAGLLLCWLRGRLPGPRHWWISLALIPVAVFLLQFPFSQPLWKLLPELRFLQFPWRWLVVLEAPMAIFVTAAIWPHGSASSWRRIAIGCACAAVFVAMTGYAARNFYQVCDDEDAVTPMLATYRSGHGFIGTYEYEPIGADNSVLAAGLPQACLVSDYAVTLGKPAVDPDAPPAWNASQGSCEATYGAAPSSQPEHLRFAATISRPGFLVLRLRSYPAWVVKVNGQVISSFPERPNRDDGLMVVPVSRGEVAVSADWKATPDVIVSRWLSGLSMLLFTGLCFIERRLSRARL
ncbi:MAG: hypothetical protein WA802_06085 [Terracidiphilus sp.]